MPRGGKRSPGRPPGSKNKKTTIEKQAIRAGGEMPAEYMLRVMRDPSAAKDRRDRMAVGCAPYYHSRMPTEVTGKGGSPLIPEGGSGYDIKEMAKAVVSILSAAAKATPTVIVAPEAQIQINHDTPPEPVEAPPAAEDIEVEELDIIYDPLPVAIPLKPLEPKLAPIDPTVTPPARATASLTPLELLRLKRAKAAGG